ncbi:MAG: DNA cytosine methyltransferase [Anaerolineae bacterium]
MKKKSYITATDQFCGAGGSSIGAVAAGAELRLALNHWRLAVDTHNTNFPQAAHDCTDISACDPRRYPSTDILITSPECTNHSLANGKKKPSKQFDMFNPSAVYPAEERSRATMWDVPRFAEYHKYNIIVVENVVDARKWVMWDAWLLAMRLLGYEHKCVYFNSMHAHPTPQSRDRMYVVFWRKGNKAPNLDIRPRAYCAKCGHDVESVQSWKNGRTHGRYRTQYQYCCPDCGKVVEPYYHCAYNAIDWSLPIVRIGDRARPLKETTLNRVRIGLEKYGQAHMMAMKDTASADWSLGLHDPLTTIVASSSQHALVTPPFLIETTFTHAQGDRSTGIDRPVPTQTTKQTMALITPPFVLSGYTRTAGQKAALAGVDQPMPTVPGRAVHGVVVPPFIASYYGTNECSQITDALPTLTTKDRHAVITPPPFLVNMQSDNSPTFLHEAMRTVLTGPHKVLIEPTESVSVDDCGFRMLEPHECGAAMAFPADYKVLGDKRQRIRQYGNAVTPPVMNMLMERCIATLR